MRKKTATLICFGGLCIFFVIFQLDMVFKFPVSVENVSVPSSVHEASLVPYKLKPEIEFRSSPNIIHRQTPFNSSNKLTVKLFIAIPTAYTTKGFKLRDAIRKTWINYQLVPEWDSEVTYRFFLGIRDTNFSKSIPLSLNERTDDIIFGDFLDNYKNLSLKTMYIAKWVSENCEFQYLLKADDDIFVRLDRYVNLLPKTPPPKYYSGSVDSFWIPPRVGVWAVPESVFPNKTGPAWIHGPLYTLSSDSVQFIASKYGHPKWPMLELEDINTAFLMYEFGATPTSMAGIVVLRSDCDDTQLAIHYATDKQMFRWYWNSLIGDHNMCINKPDNQLEKLKDREEDVSEVVAGNKDVPLPFAMPVFDAKSG